MTIDFEDEAARFVSSSDVRCALVAVTRLLLDEKMVGLLPVQVQSELPNVRRCILELHALRAARSVLERVGAHVVVDNPPMGRKRSPRAHAVEQSTDTAARRKRKRDKARAVANTARRGAG